MIAKTQYLTGIFMGIIGVGLSMLLECNWHGQKNLLKFLIFYW
jgi:hypothetical protein